MSEDKYLNRITSQHKIQPRYMAWLSALLGKVQDLVDVAEQIEAAFDLEHAVGVQLDAIGQLVGVSRLLDFEPTYAPSALLTDDYYRTIIRAKISLNQWDGTTAGIKQLWEGIFSEYTMEVIDNQDMTMTIRVYGLKTMFEGEYISHGYAAPKPEGVGMHYEFVLSLELDASIYIGAIVADIRTGFRLNPLSHIEDIDASTALGIGSKVTNIRNMFILRERELAEDTAITGQHHIGGAIGNTREYFTLKARSTTDIAQNLTEKIYTFGGVEVFRTAWNLPDATNERS